MPLKFRTPTATTDLPAPHDPFGALDRFETGHGPAQLYRLSVLADAGYDLGRLPVSIRILLEGLLRRCDGETVTAEDVRRLAAYDPGDPAEADVPFMPSRVLLQDFTGVPAVVDLAALRSAMARLGGDPQAITPQVPVHLIIDHSVQVDHYGLPDAVQLNSEIEFRRNEERYKFLRWGQQAFDDFGVVPPASGICHQVNLEYVARGVWTRETESGLDLAYPDTLVGTDSHTTMINGLGVLGWGVGGIDAEAALLGQPLHMLMPEVVGVRFTGELAEGATATDLVLTVTQMLRDYGVVGRFVEFFGPGLRTMTVPDRATIANMSPEYGATTGFFPVDDETLDYMRRTNRSEEQVQLVEYYMKEQGLFHAPDTPEAEYLDVLELDLSDIVPSVSEEIKAMIEQVVKPEFFAEEYEGIETSNETWNQIEIPEGSVYEWEDESTYIQEPPFFVDPPIRVEKRSHGSVPPKVPLIEPIEGARVLVKVGDSTTTDHISPAGAIPPDSPAGKYLIEQGVEPHKFNSYGARRGNHEVMMRGTFANIRIKNELVPGTEGGVTKNFLRDGEVTSVYEAAMDYKDNDVPLVVLAGADYGMGSSRDWAAKGTDLLGVEAVIAASYERIHRSNLIGMGVLPLQFADGEDADALGLDGTETFDIPVPDDLAPGQEITVTATAEDGTETAFTTITRCDTPIEVEYYRNGGILHYVLRDVIRQSMAPA